MRCVFNIFQIFLKRPIKFVLDRFPGRGEAVESHDGFNESRVTKRSIINSTISLKGFYSQKPKLVLVLVLDRMANRKILGLDSKKKMLKEQDVVVEDLEIRKE